eukprot:15365699-Ditylum_brightwellii.AAC.1
MDRKHPLFPSSSSDVSNYCSGLTSSQPAKLCIFPKKSCSVKTHKKNFHGLLQPKCLYILLSRQLAYPLAICSKWQLSKNVYMALSFQALSLNDGISLRHARTGKFCKEANAYVISSLLDGVDPSLDRMLHAASPLPTSPQQK